MTDVHQTIKNRLNSLYKDATEAEQNKGFGLEHSAEVIHKELNQLLQFAQEKLPESDLSLIDLNESVSSLGDRGFMQFVKTNIRKMADLLDIEFDLDRTQGKSQTVFNLNQTQNVSQYSSQTFSNMISNISQLEIDIDKKTEVLKLINKFKDEATNPEPDHKKLVGIWNKVKSISAEAAAMLSYYATVTGVWDKILEQISK